MPGYGYSGKPTTTGWGPAHIARAWSALMKRLGHTRYVAQGGDWGAVVVDVMATLGHPELIGIHTNMPGAIPADVDAAALPARCRQPVSQPTKRRRTSSWYSSISTLIPRSTWRRARKR